MSIISDKKSVLDSVVSINSLSDSLSTLNKLDFLDSFNSDVDLNTKDVIPFFISLLTTLEGVENTKNLINNIIQKSSVEFNKIIKEQLKNQVLSINNSKLEPITINISQIDPNGNLKIRDNNNIVFTENKLIGGQIYNSIIDFLDNNTASDTFYNYSFTGSTGNVLLTPVISTDTQINLLNKIIDNTNFISSKIIVSEVLQLLFGSNYKLMGSTQNQILKNETTNLILNKAIDNEDINNEIFNLNDNDLKNLQSSIDKANKGNLIDVDCSYGEVTLSKDEINNIINSTNPIDSISTSLNNNINDSDNNVKYSDDSNKQKRQEFLNNNKTLSKFKNKSAMQSKLTSDIVKSVSFIIVKNSILSSQFLMIQNIIDCYSKGITISSSPNTDQEIIKNNKNILVCIIKALKNKFTTLIYNELIKLIKKKILPVVTSIVAEKLKAYVNQLTSLVGY
jgi:hypothetical protein